MATWKLSPQYKKSAVERSIWTKDGVTVVREEGYRWGTFYCESDERPDIDLDNPDGIDVFSTDYDFELDNLDDGCSLEIEYPDDMPEEEQERLDELWDEDSYDGWESDGWSNVETETWFHGPLNLEQG